MGDEPIAFQCAAVFCVLFQFYKPEPMKVNQESLASVKPLFRFFLRLQACLGCVLALIGLFPLLPAWGQNAIFPEDSLVNLPFAFRKSDSEPVVRWQDGRVLENAWFGGLNAVHTAAIDLDGDGTDDYILFDRIGSRVRCFSSAWEAMPGLENQLPALSYWVQTLDYNQDGLKDIFTFNGISGIRLYRNESYADEDGYHLAFTLVTDGLPALMFGSPTPVYCTNEDFPVIADIDGDGDWDILNFWVPSSGDFLLFYRNFAMENLGRADTFCLEVADWSWGCFVESEESNQIFLDSCSSRNESRNVARMEMLGRLDSRSGDAVSILGGVPGSGEDGQEGWVDEVGIGIEEAGKEAGAMACDAKNEAKHAGSTIFGIENPQSGLYDIVLGDVGYPGLYYLQNGGTSEEAHIAAYDTVFPLSEPVQLYNFPVISTIYYQDTLCYLLSPYETDPFNAEGSQSVWRYAETGFGPAWSRLLQKDFLQDRMLDFGAGAYPVAYDYDHDGLTDLVVGNYGRKTGAYYELGDWNTVMVSSLAMLRNVGTASQPAFELVSDDFLGLSEWGLRALYPCFSDLDGDGQDEMVLGMEDGRLWLFRIQDAGLGKSLGQAVLLDSNFLEVTLNRFSAPVFFDLNQDGLPDLIAGERQHVWQTRPQRLTKGSLTYFENQGAGADGIPVFVKQTDSLGGVDVIDRSFSNFGYARPSFFQAEDGEIYLACGSENGEVFLYSGIRGNLDGTFTYLGKVACSGLGEGGAEAASRKLDVGIHAAPLLYDFTGDGLPELIVGNQCGGLQYFTSDALSIWEDAASAPPSPKLDIKIYPNPVYSGFYLEVPCPGVFRLFDAGGRLVRYCRLKDGKQYIELQDMMPGIYIGRFQASNGGTDGSPGFKIVKL